MTPEAARNSRPSQRGTVLVLSLLVVSAIAGLGAWVVQLQASMARRMSQSTDRKRALYVAEAGLAESVLAMSQGKSGELGSEDLPVRFHDGIYWVESETLNDGRRILTSRGQVGAGEFAVRVTVWPNTNPVGASGYFGDEGVVIGDAVIIDGYNGRLGNYAAHLDPAITFRTTGRGGLVSSNGDIEIDDAAGWPGTVQHPYATAFTGLPAHVADEIRVDTYCSTWLQDIQNHKQPLNSHLYAELQPGPDGTVLTNGGSHINTIVPSVVERFLPMPLAPTVEQTVTGSYTVSTHRTVERCSRRFDSIRVTAGGILTLTGPTILHVGDLVVEHDGGIRLNDRNGPIFIAVDSQFDFEPGSYLSTIDEDRRRFGTYIFMLPDADPANDQRIELDCAGDFRGMIYAPADRVALQCGLRIWGSVAAKHLTIGDGTWLTFDHAFRIGGTGVPAFPRQISWEMIEEEGEQRPLGFDPLRALALNGIEPLDSATAAPESSVRATYIDSLGDRQVRTGPITTLDFADVSRFVGLEWQDPDTSAFGESTVPTGHDPDSLVESHRLQLRQARLLEYVITPP